MESETDMTRTLPLDPPHPQPQGRPAGAAGMAPRLGGPRR